MTAKRQEVASLNAPAEGTHRVSEQSGAAEADTSEGQVGGGGAAAGAAAAGGSAPAGAAASAPGADETPKEPYPAHCRAQVVAKGLKSGRFVQGELRMMKRTRFIGAVTCGDEEILVSGSMALNRAIDGDTVVVERLDAQQAVEYEGAAKRLRHGVVGGSVSEADDMEQALEGMQALRVSGKSKGRVVSIVKRNKKLLPGSIQSLETSGQLGIALAPGERAFMPADPRFPLVIVRPTDKSQKLEESEDTRVIVAVDVWDRFSEYPKGHWTRTLGKTGDVNVETEMILIEHNVSNEPFSEEVLACLPPADFKPKPKDIRGRRDFRDVCVCSIDPPGCEDIDDALSCEVLPSGNFSVGVHIADVTHFVHPDTALDLEAASRGTSVYLVDRRIDMLPRLLTTEVCSLRDDGQDRLTFSVVFEMTPDAEIVSEQFHKAVIRSRGALSYGEAQERLDGDSSDTSDVTMAIRRLYKLAMKLRKRRMDNGALELMSEELKFELDAETQLPTNLFKYESFATNQLIEEFMLLANQAAARRTSELYDQLAVLRCHPPPKPESMKDLTRLLDCHGVTDFKYGSNKELSQSLDGVEKPGDPFFNYLVRVMTTRCMNEAYYFCTGKLKKKEWVHYGLAMSRYTHFTSPIRRYADCLVHRFLADSLHIAPLSASMLDSTALAEQVDKINYKHKMAQWSDRASVDLHLYLYFKARGKIEAEGVVTRVGKTGVSVAVEDYGAEGQAFLRPLDWVIIKDAQKAHGRPLSKFEGMTIGVFDRVMVSVQADLQDKKYRNLRFELIGLPGAMTDMVEGREITEMVEQ